MSQACEYPTVSPVSVGPRNLSVGLFLISVLGLFLELMLIRWIGTEVRLFAYLQNTVLVVCFLGLGLGCLTCKKPVALRDLLIPLFVLVTLLAIPVTRIALGKTSEMLAVFDDMIIWYGGAVDSPAKTILYAALGLGLAFLLMALICDIFIPVGRLLGQLMDRHPRPVVAYSVNVVGSLIGIWLFVLLSALYQPPLTWFALAAVTALFFLSPPGRVRSIELVLMVGIVGMSWLAGYEFGSETGVWSPYQKLVVEKTGKDRQEAEGLARWVTRETVSIHAENLGEYAVRVNNVGYQWMFDLRPEETAKDPERYVPAMKGLSQYDIPARLHPGPKKMLIVGAGSGNDAAGGLRQGVPEIVAVEIDPAIIMLGKQFHPERPYDNPKVRIVNDDARSFFASTTERFDLIVFGLLDSHTTTSLTNARLDHYVYTRESIERARGLLPDGGVIALSFASTHPFIADRMGRVVAEVFGQKPLSYLVPHTNYGTGGILFVAGNLDAVRQHVAQQPRLAGLLQEWTVDEAKYLPGTARVATDDWPYIYLDEPRIPLLYLLLAALLPVLFWRGTRRLEGPSLWSGWDQSHWHFFFMGAAFLLLEVQNISKASVIFGNTWWVNAVIISGILIMILLANGSAAVFPRLPLAPVYLMLIGSCLVLYYLDLAAFGSLPFLGKVVLVGGLTSLPMLFSGMVFIRSFAVVPHKHTALGANLFGALVGGLLQSLTFVIGIKALLLIVAGLYCAALLTRPTTASEPAVALAPQPA
jgi:spermidine synthase